jgi:hypothetical protein
MVESSIEEGPHIQMTSSIAVDQGGSIAHETLHRAYIRSLPRTINSSIAIVHLALAPLPALFNAQ